MRERLIRRLLAGVTVITLVACGTDGGSSTPHVSTSAPPLPSLSLSPTVTRPPGSDPAAFPPDGAGVVVTGSIGCGFQVARSVSEGLITTHTGQLRCTHAMSDPRVSGSEVTDMTVVWTEQPGLTIDKWFYPTGTLTNDGGTWRASGWGSEFWDEDDEIHTSGTSVYVGEGAYAGLVYRLLYAQGAGISSDLIEYIAAGWIEPAP